MFIDATADGNFSELEGALHSTGGMVGTEQSDGTKLNIETFDALLTAPDNPQLLTVPHKAATGTHSVWFNLGNNVRNTNFPIWNSGPSGFRFKITTA